MKDHPRLCGEKCNALCKPDCMTGSPPPMRGKGCDNLTGYVCPGITPAYAGKRKHPANGTDCRGSPPPMRGKGVVPDMPAPQSGITPAYAGKRSMNLLPAVKSWDHPRLCGEKSISGTLAGTGAGSPPPMRGKESTGNWERRLKRITPAYAGKSETKSISNSS